MCAFVVRYSHTHFYHSTPSRNYLQTRLIHTLDKVLYMCYKLQFAVKYRSLKGVYHAEL